MTRRFSIRPTLTVKGRKWKGLRGWAGKPFHPPLTDIPVAAYLFAALFDVVSVVSGDGSAERAEFLYKSATWLLVGGYVVGVLAVITGWADWHRSSTVGTQARRTINTHAGMMIIVQVLVLIDILIRTVGHDDDVIATPGSLAVVTVVAATFCAVSATYGGSLVFDYGFNVETSGDHPVWHVSETDVFPGDPH
jgi:uncharacterized membrane protein